MSFLDVFANGLGAALLLMVFFTLRLTGTVGRPSDESRRPVVIHATWTTELPPAGLGDATLRIRLVSSRSTNEGVQTLGIVGTPGPNGRLLEQRQALGLTLLPGNLGSNVFWRLQMQLTLRDFPTLPGEEFHRFATNLYGRWRELDRADPITRPRLQEELGALAGGYLDFQARLADLRQRWESLERTLVRRAGESDDAWFGRIARQRAATIHTTFANLSVSPFAYPPKPDSGRSFYDRFFSVDTTGRLQPRPFALDVALTHRSWLELSAPGAGHDMSRRRWIWTGTARALCQTNASLPLNLHVEGPGLDGRGVPIAVARPLEYDSSGWRDLASISVDAQGRLSLHWNRDSEIHAPPQPAPSPPNIVSPTRWETALWEFDNTPSDLNALARVDDALVLLDKRIGSDGRIASPVSSSVFQGPGVDGLALLAFLMRGHGVGHEASDHQTNTARLAARLCQRSLAADGRAHQELDGSSPTHAVYHLGFAIIALSRALTDLLADGTTIPRVGASATLTSEDFRKALDLAVTRALSAPSDHHVYRHSANGLLGWSYSDASRESIDMSVTVVFAKAFDDTLKAAQLPGRKDELITALRQIANSMAEARRGSLAYRYRLNQPAITRPADGHFRLAGCLLAEHLGSAIAPPGWTNNWLEFVAMPPPTLDGQYDHYALFYGAHLLQIDRTETRAFRDEWYTRTRQTLFRRQDLNGGSFAHQMNQADHVAYQHSMAIILLALPLRQHVIDQFTFPTRP